MGWKSDAKGYKQECYGGYCNMARQLGEEVVPYHAFEVEMMLALKKRIRDAKKAATLPGTV